MKTLQFQSMSNVDVLSRSEIKNVLGGQAVRFTVRPSKEGEYCNWMDIKCEAGLTCWSTNNPSSPDQGKCVKTAN
ncbi:hypothetical protein KTO58_04870 [Chitinophaga pendula]|uniref:hypothetical protein n=1 Tax=Chitinophaga TaxID=79328 RepID=UPI000BAEEB1D|nr:MULTISPECIES: hypothetical protein [Chitinophaga]ASZ13851.1 hypothetical protein CK934_24300 [Chitinophaga sp. MD30]UCJ08526.1 hypothetical protein KTO58_04870 [Chitinophaga pendula]